ncbi:MAG: bifunctional folylpolyglutamate synthase/dihydrofolate synthase [Hyphomicrobiales bacterium]
MPMPHRQTHTDCLNTLFALRRFGIKLGLATMRRILAGLGNPQRRFKSIHVAGTNGKGSVASGLAAILRGSGYRVGLYTSPHLVRFNERIQVNGAQISDADIVRLYRRVHKALPSGREPTFFEFTTAMAFDEFARRRVDWAVIETGMGGRLDATNVISPELTIITNISLEHREYLGKTIPRIAFEKAGIIKRRRPIVTGVRQPSAFAILSETARRKSAPVYRLGDAFSFRRTGAGVFTYRGIDQVWPDMVTTLQGDYQVENAALVLAACELLLRKAPRISLESMRAGLLAHRWPGRLEVVSEMPLVMLDGAHNLDAAKQLARHVRTHFTGRDVTMVVGILDDKPYAAMLKLLLPMASRVVVTQAKINRALPAEKIEAVANTLVTDIRIIRDVGEALRFAVDTATSETIVLVAGSLYVVGEAKAALEKRSVQPG